MYESFQTGCKSRSNLTPFKYQPRRAYLSLGGGQMKGMEIFIVGEKHGGQQ